jgi:hypothetical protein
MEQPKYYLNLTNGIEFLAKYPTLAQNFDIGFIRIQSSLCEAKKWQKIIDDLDYGFLMDLALGRPCVVVDYSQRKAVSRALFQGLEWIKYVLNREWFGIEYPSFVKRHNCTKYFSGLFKRLKKQKIRHVKKFLIATELLLESFSQSTKKDGEQAFYKNVLKDYIDNELREEVYE